MSAFVTYVGNCDVQRGSHLALHCGIPLVNRWEALNGWPDSRADVARRSSEWKNAIGWNRDGDKSRWALGQRKHSASVVRRTRAARRLLRAVCVRKCLVRENRKVLRHDVPEVRAKDADIKSASVTNSQDRFWIELIGKAEPGCERFVRVLHISVQVVRAYASHANNASIDVREAALGFAVDTLREINLPAQAVGHRKFWRYAPGVLTIEEPTLLAFRGVQARADEPLKRGYVAQQECRKAITTDAAICRVSRIDVQQTGTAGIARHAKVLGIANISAELQRMIALRSCPVIDELNLLFAFRQRAVAASDV